MAHRNVLSLIKTFKFNKIGTSSYSTYNNVYNKIAPTSLIPKFRQFSSEGEVMS